MLTLLHVCNYTLAVHALLLDQHYKFKLCCIGKLAFDWLSAWKLSPYQSVPVHIYFAFCKHENFKGFSKVGFYLLLCLSRISPGLARFRIWPYLSKLALKRDSTKISYFHRIKRNSFVKKENKRMFFLIFFWFFFYPQTLIYFYVNLT